MPKNNKTKTAASTKASTKKTTRSPYPYAEFVKHWSKSNSLAEVCTATGLSRNTVSAIASRLRKNKVQLKKMPQRQSQPINPSELNRIIKDTSASA